MKKPLKKPKICIIMGIISVFLAEVFILSSLSNLNIASEIIFLSINAILLTLYIWLLLWFFERKFRGKGITLKRVIIGYIIIGILAFVIMFFTNNHIMIQYVNSSFLRIVIESLLNTGIIIIALHLLVFKRFKNNGKKYTGIFWERLNFKFCIAVLGFLLLIVIVAVVSYQVIEQQKGKAFLVNLAGRQRTLIIKMIQDDLTAYLLMPTDTTRDTIETNNNPINPFNNPGYLFRQTASAMLYGGKITPNMFSDESSTGEIPDSIPPINDRESRLYLLNALKKFTIVERYITNLSPHLNPEERKLAIDIILEEGTAIVHLMDRLTRRIQEISDVRISYFTTIQKLSLVLMLIFFIASAIFSQQKISATLARQQSEKKYRILFEQSRDAIYISTRDGRFIDVNKSMLALFGYSKEEMLKIGVLGLYVNPDDRDKLQKEMETKGSVYDYEVQLRKKDGTTARCLITSMLWHDKDGSILGYEGVIRDITKRKRIEEEREALQRLSQKLTEPLGIKEIGKVLGVESRKLFRHNAFSFDLIDERRGLLISIYNEDTPYDSEEPQEVATTDIPIQSIKHRNIFEQEPLLINRKEEPKDTNLFRFGEKSRLSRSLMFVPIIWENKTVGVLSVQSYIPNQYGEDELKLLQTIAHQSSGAVARAGVEEKLRKLSRAIEQTADQVMITDKNGIIEFVNPAFEKLTGYSKEETIGKTPRILKSGKHNKAHYKKIWQTILKGNVYRGETINRKKNGELYYEAKTITPIKNEHGKIISFVSTGMDITEKKKAEEELKKTYASLNEAWTRASKIMAELETTRDELQSALEAAKESDRLKSEFLANTSHELRTPLNSIIGFLQLILDGMCDSPEEEKEFITYALESANNLLQIINDVLDIAKIEAGKVRLELKVFDLKDVLDEVYLTTYQKAKEKNIHFEVKLDSDKIFVYADYQKVKQIFTNLIGNSLKFTPEGSIVVTAEESPERDYVIISIHDTGIGIPTDKHKTVFKKFTQVDGSTSRRFGGTGLGLSITKSFVDLMGGEIELNSPGDLGGTTVIFTLPGKQIYLGKNQPFN